MKSRKAAEKSGRFVGRAPGRAGIFDFRHDKKAVFSSGVLTSAGLKAHFSAACKVCDG